MSQLELPSRLRFLVPSALAIIVALLNLIAAAQAQTNPQPGHLTVKVNQPGVKISPMLYGLMTEEINHSYDGGLYAELIQNRAFHDFANTPAHWSVVKSGSAQGAIALDTADPVNTTALTTSLRLNATTADNDRRVGIANDGYWGIPVRPETAYRASFYAKAAPGFAGPLTVDIESADGATVYAKAQVPKLTTEWRQVTVTLTTGKVTASTANRFVISISQPATLWFSQVSLFPPTFNDRPNGNRIDLVQKMAEMKPAFLRLPGGNYLEGDRINEHFPWKQTLGDIATRPGHPGCWKYRSSDGTGLLEFLEWCDDLHMEPVLAVFAGYALRGDHIEPGPALQPFVQEALDEIEYLVGDQNSKWGQERINDGHLRPFALHYVEIGNEDWFDKSRSYDGRFAQFYDAIKAKYPSLQLIATTAVKSRIADLIDDHYYRSAREMERDSTHYDSYSRTNPTKVFVGEWASQEGRPTPNLNGALGDAAWLTGLERNSDVVVMECYAPLLVNVNPGGSQWPTNLIGYDAMSSFGSPSYYVQSMFARNRGDTVLPVELNERGDPLTTALAHGAVGVGAWNTSVEYKDIKVTHGDTALYQPDLAKGLADWKLGGGNWKAVDGVLQQTATVEGARATVGDASWTDYTLSLKARKTAGAEGFLILFHVIDNDNFAWWNIGGWGNTRTSIEIGKAGSKSEVSRSRRMKIDNDRWYDIRVEVKGHDIRCYLDGKLTSEGTDVEPSAMYSTASRDDGTGDVIIKTVNTYPTPQRLEINLQGITTVDPNATIDFITGQPTDVNSVAQPEKVAPKHAQITDAAAKFSYEFPAYSVSVMRVKTR